MGELNKKTQEKEKEKEGKKMRRGRCSRGKEDTKVKRSHLNLCLSFCFPFRIYFSKRASRTPAWLGVCVAVNLKILQLPVTFCKISHLRWATAFLDSYGFCRIVSFSVGDSCSFVWQQTEKHHEFGCIKVTAEQKDEVTLHINWFAV